jgi:hypothetical protein
MKALFLSMILLLLPSTGLLLAAESLTVHPTQITTPYGVDSGCLVTAGDQMVFVDNTNPANSFAIPRNQVTNTNLTNGVLTVTLAQPFVSPVASNSTVIIQPMDGSSQSLAQWIGVSWSSTAPITTGQANPIAVSPSPATYDYSAKFDRHEGMLQIGATEVSFFADNPKRSIAWNYDVIKKIKNEPGRDRVVLVLRGGDREIFDLMGSQTVTDDALNAANQRIAAAPHYHG